MEHNVKSYQRRLKTEKQLPFVHILEKVRMVEIRKIPQVSLLPEMNL